MCEAWMLNGFHQALPWLLICSGIWRLMLLVGGYLPPGDTATGWKQVKRTGHRFPLHPRGSLAPTGCIIVNFHLKKQNSIHSCSISTHKSRFLEAVSLMSLQNKRQNQSFIQKHFKTNRSRPLFLLLTVACPTLIKFKNLEMTPAF